MSFELEGPKAQRAGQPEWRGAGCDPGRISGFPRATPRPLAAGALALAHWQSRAAAAGRLHHMGPLGPHWHSDRDPRARAGPALRGPDRAEGRPVGPLGRAARAGSPSAMGPRHRARLALGHRALTRVGRRTQTARCCGFKFPVLPGPVPRLQAPVAGPGCGHKDTDVEPLNPIAINKRSLTGSSVADTGLADSLLKR